MSQINIKGINYLRERLPARVIDALEKTALKYSKKGAVLFVFASFSTGTDKHNSDIDIGVMWQVEPSRDTFVRINEDILLVPTIRKIDVVDMSCAGEQFKFNAIRSPIFLT